MELEEERKQIKKLKCFFSESMINNNIDEKGNKSERKNHKENYKIQDENSKEQKLNLFNKSFKKSTRNILNNLFEMIKFSSKVGTSFSNIKLLMQLI